MTRMVQTLAAITAVFTGSACGFEPVYRGDLSASQGQIDIAQIDGRTGHEVRKALLEETIVGLPGVNGPATLEVELRERINRLAFRADGAASRSSVRLQAVYTLQTDAGPLRGRAESEVYFFVPSDVFGDITAQTNAARQAANDVARRIVEDVRLKLLDEA